MRKPLPESKLRAWRGLLNAHSAAIRRINQFLAERGGLPLESYDVLLELHETPDKRLRLRDLGDRIVLTRSGISRLVSRLEREGLVARRTVASDGRGVFAVLTPKGEESFRKTWPLYAEGIDAFFGSLMNEAEAKRLAAVLERVP